MDEEKIVIDWVVQSLVDERIKQGVTQQEIAELTGMQAPNITRIESCRHTTSLKVLMKYAEALGKQISIDIKDKEEE